ncbi:hypothetical protein EDD85DRAFT_957937 [Armillaria nabsnona]|nr:hypothetical protein EDD85DRAFT_957937 [Armillaria nabsnona]
MSGVASMTHRIEQWFASYDVDDTDDLHITHSLDKSSSRGGFTYGGSVPSSVHSKTEMEELERLEEQLAARCKIIFQWRLDSVAVFNEAKARAFSEGNTQSEHELRQMGKHTGSVYGVWTIDDFSC